MADKYWTLDESIAQLRAELKREFPGVKFSVTRARGTAYGWVRVSWVDGPTGSDVRAITAAYEGSGFDGMTDSSYTITHVAADSSGNPVTVHHGIRSINTDRKLSADYVNSLIPRIVAYWGGVDPATVPVAVQDTYGYSLVGADCWRPIRPDLDLDWQSAIYRAADGAYMKECSE